MTCSTCGRENPAHLTFCQECGQRLGPRIAPPTPPIGLGSQDAYGPPPNPPQQDQQRQLDRAAAMAALGATNVMAEPPVMVGTGDRRCKICDTVNGPNLRYCTSCGSTLEPAGNNAPRAAAPPPAPQPAAPQPAIAQAPSAIAPMRVVDLGKGGGPPEASRTCTRCRGVADASAQFCKFCGASLADAQPIPSHAPQQQQQQQQPPQFSAAPSPVLSSMLPHERLDLPRANGSQNEPSQPMSQVSSAAMTRGPNPPTAPIAQVAPQVLASMQQRPAPPLPIAQAPSPQPIAQAAIMSPSPSPAFPSAYGPPPNASANPQGQGHGGGGAAAALAAIPRPPSAPPIAPIAAAPVAQQHRESRPEPPPAPPAVIQQQQQQPSRAPAIPAPVAATTRGRLVVIAKSGADGPSYPFGDLLDIGRTEGNVIVAEDPYLSPRHVRIVWQANKLTLRDLGSTNGVFLRLAPSRDTTPRRSSDNPEVAVPLVDNDLILVGQQVLRFDILREGEGGFGPAQEHGTLLFGSPAAPRYARLCQRTVEGIARDIYYVRKVETVLGRESGDVVFTEDPFLSRRHAAIRLLTRDGSAAVQASGSKPPPSEGRFALVDLGSSNGTFLRIRGDVELAPGDHFRVGQQLFRVDFELPPGARG